MKEFRVIHHKMIANKQQLVTITVFERDDVFVNKYMVTCNGQEKRSSKDYAQVKKNIDNLNSCGYREIVKVIKK